jgi:hypothetical protein
MHQCQSMVSGCSSRHRCFGRNEYGKNRQCQGKFLVNSGSTGAILNAEFVMAHKLPWVRRKTPVQVGNADGTPSRMQGPNTRLH